MFKSLQKKLLFITLIFSCSLLQAEIPNTDNQNSYVGTTGKAKYTNSFTDNTAFSVLGEAGPRNYRAGATLG
ncbi:MAG: hypothetical protein H0U73_05340 [Tatlockia sp.]|nr:hypothetical protein [Tatlockia sp.]